MSVFATDFIWLIDSEDVGGISSVVNIVTKHKLSVSVKYHDGDPSDDKWGFDRKFRLILEGVKQSNPELKVFAWGYCYGNRYGNLEKEVNAAVQAIKDGADGYIIDAEGEWEFTGAKDWVKRFCEGFLTKTGNAPLALTSFYAMRYHSLFPLREFSSYVKTALPQIYHVLAGRHWSAMLDEAFEDYANFQEIFPVFDFSVNDLETVKQIVRHINVPCSWWSMEIAGKDFEEFYKIIEPKTVMLSVGEFNKYLDAWNKLEMIRKILGGE